MFDLSAKVVIVTGSVGRLGAVTARTLRERGARTVLADRSEDRLSEAHPSLVDSPDHLLVGGVDLSEEASVARLVERARARFGRIDGLAHTVGSFSGPRGLAQEDPATWDRLLVANLRTALNACRAVAPEMARNRSGSVVTVAARAAQRGRAGLAAYCAAKSAVVRLTESLAAELGPAGARANCVLPGTLDTAEARSASTGADPGDWVLPEDVANVIAFLISDAARALNGTSLPLGGT